MAFVLIPSFLTRAFNALVADGALGEEGKGAGKRYRRKEEV
jgi:hypothetical protein